MIVRKAYHLCRALRRQYWHPKRLEEFRLRRLKRMVHHAYDQCDFYRSLYDEHGVGPDCIGSLEDLVKLPPLEKSCVQSMSQRFLADSAKRYAADIERAFATGEHLQDTYNSGFVFRRTSGSTGRRLIVTIDGEAWDEFEAIYARSVLGTGHGMTQLLAVSTAYVIPPPRWFARLGLMRKTYIPLSLPLEEQARQLAERPGCDWYSYPTNLLAMARAGYGRQTGIRLHRIICTAEVLSESVRAEAERAFGCPVFNHYGTMEFNRMAWECERREGLHEDADSVIMEVIRDGRPAAPGEEGEVFVTGLVNRAMPLIRYRLGDVLVKKAGVCSCGRTLPLLDRIDGRQNDLVVSQRGGLVSPAALDTALCHVRAVQQLKLIQKDVGRFEAQVIPFDGFDDALCRDEVRETVMRITGDDTCELTIVVTDKMERTAGGKLQSVVSELSRERAKGRKSAAEADP